jgi:GWxTD domain-containing protein
MSALYRRLPPLLGLLLAMRTLAAAEGPTVDTRHFPRLTHLFLLPEERELLKELKDDKDRREFQKLFWARRDPTPGTPANEFEDNVRGAWRQADELFSYPNQKGSETGCGQVLALLGRPEEVLGLEVQPTFDSLRAIREGARRAETWIYRDRPGRPYAFTRAELRVAFDAECRFAEAGIVAHDLERAAAALVTRPELAYARGGDGRLLPLAAQSGGASGAAFLLATPRSDFPLGTETKLVLRAPRGEALVAGLARFPEPQTGGPPGGVTLAVRATDASGRTVASAARESAVAPATDGMAVASWGLSLKPGRFQLKVAVRRPDTGEGSVSAFDLDVPDFAANTLAASPLVLYPDEPQAKAAPDARDPHAALQLGSIRLRPRFGNLFAPRDALMVVATLYGARVDNATGQASLRARYTILKDGKLVARGAEDVFRTPDAVASVGPIPLSSYAPGSYVVRLDVSDDVAGQTLRQEAAFEIRAAGGTP